MNDTMEISNNSKEVSYVSKLPTELLYKIFQCLSANDLMKSRQICKRWKAIVDEIASNDLTWKNFCRKNFSDCYSKARLKANPELKWFNLYKSLCLWPKLNEAVESQKLAPNSHVDDEFRNVEVLNGGVLLVHKKSAIEHYNIDTLRLSITKSCIEGDYEKYIENDHVIVILTIFCHLFVIVKVDMARNYHTTFDNVKIFLLTETELFFVTLNDEIYVCDVRNEIITPNFIQQNEDFYSIKSLGYSNGSLNILTCKRHIYSVVDNKEVIFKQSIHVESNLLDVLHKYNLLEELDWRSFYHWLYVLQRPIPKEPMCSISVIKPYGDIFFVGTHYGVLYIFNKPYINGELDIFNSQPIKQINFAKRSIGYAPTTFSIIKIDVVEIENGHVLFVALPMKLVVLKYTHNMQSPSWIGVN